MPCCKVTAAFILSYLVYPRVKTRYFFPQPGFSLTFLFFSIYNLTYFAWSRAVFLYIRLRAKTNTKPVANTTSGPARCENSIHTSALLQGGGAGSNVIWLVFILEDCFLSGV